MATPLLETSRLLVRDMQPDDLDDFHRYRSNQEVVRYQGFDVYSREQAQAFIAQQEASRFGEPGQWKQFSIVLRSTGRLIGDCALKLEAGDPPSGEIGITISHLHQRQGFAKEALTGLVGYLFDQRGVRRVVETVDAENEASIALLESTGFRKEGHFIENIFFKGKWGSECQYALLRREWEALSKA